MRVLFFKCAFLIVVFVNSGCATNPVTGRNDLNFVSMAKQAQIGREQYGPSQQSQGGLFRVDPILTEYVEQVGLRLAAVSDVPMDYEFVVLNNSIPNAWALPGGKIAINRGLLMQLNNEAELAAVLGHEIVHAAAGHGAQAITRGTLLQGVLAVGAAAVSDERYSDYIIGAAQIGTGLITQRYGRDAERESDYYGIRYMIRAGYDPKAAVTLQQTFVRLSEDQESKWLNGLFASHPPSYERVQNNQQLVNELEPQLEGRDFELGEFRFQQAMKSLQKTAESYALMDEAESAIRDRDFDIALINLQTAKSMVPKEARFLGLEGDIKIQEKNYVGALDSYNAAIELDNNYFDYWLGRGVANARLGRRAEARGDLIRSNELLPTAMAANELGALALQDGDRNSAKNLFKAATIAGGELGRQAKMSYLKLDLEDNPNHYVEVNSLIDQSGEISVLVSNLSGIQLKNVRIKLSLVNQGIVNPRELYLVELPAEGRIQYSTGWFLPSGAISPENYLEVEFLRIEF